MISRSSIPKQISKGGKMPKGPGTYGSKIGRPPKKKKYEKGGSVMSRVKAVKEGRVGPKFVTMELFNRGMSKLKTELKKAFKKKG